MLADRDLKSDLLMARSADDRSLVDALALENMNKSNCFDDDGIVQIVRDDSSETSQSGNSLKSSHSHMSFTQKQNLKRRVTRRIMELSNYDNTSIASFDDQSDIGGNMSVNFNALRTGGLGNDEKEQAEYATARGDNKSDRDIPDAADLLNRSIGDDPSSQDVSAQAAKHMDTEKRESFKNKTAVISAFKLGSTNEHDLNSQKAAYNEVQHNQSGFSD